MLFIFTVIDLKGSCSLYSMLWFFIITNFTFISCCLNLLKERTVKETEIQTVQRKVRKLPSEELKMYVFAHSKIID